MILKAFKFSELLYNTKLRSVGLLSCSAFAIILMIALYLLSTSPNQMSNGFQRVFPPHIVRPFKIINVMYNSFYIAGINTHEIFLGNTSAPDLMLRTSFFGDTTRFRLKIKSNPRSVGGSTLYIDSSNVYLLNGNNSVVLTGNLHDGVSHLLKTDFQWTSSIPLTTSSYIFRAVAEKIKRNTLVKQSGNNIMQKNNILQKQIDGIFCTDGQLVTSCGRNEIVYIYTYRNEFIRMDTNLNVMFKAKTIDTNKIAKIEIDTVKSKSRITLSYRGTAVNKFSCIGGNYLFVYSNLKADNEEQIDFKENSVIDVYSLEKGFYLYSLYLSNFNGHKIKEFGVSGNNLFALYERDLVLYKMSYPTKLINRKLSN